MQKKWRIVGRSKGPSLIMICLLIFSGLFGLMIFDDLSNSSSVTAQTIIVDPNGSGNYTTIQAAINNANAGDIIRVWSGWYNETITISKMLTIIGNGTLNTTINGTGAGDVVRITADFVNISGFTILNSGSGTSDAGIELSSVSNCRIENCSCSNGGTGIYLTFATDNYIINTNGSFNRYYGIYLYRSCIDNNIIKCTTNSNNNGIYLFWGSSRNNITNCTSNLNSNGISLSWQCTDNRIENCTVNNNNNGISISSDTNIIKNCTTNWNTDYGISIGNSQANEFYNNTMLGCGFRLYGTSIAQWNTHRIDNTNLVNNKTVYFLKNQNGFSGTIPKDIGQLILANCTYINITGFNLTSCSVGIQLGFCNYNNITNNNLSSNFVGLTLHSSSNNNISDCKSYLNKNAGIYLQRSSYNNIRNTTCNNNGANGIHLDSFGDYMEIFNCSGNYNSENGVYIYNSRNNNIVNSSFESNLNGIYLDYTSNNILRNVKLNSNLAAGLFTRNSRNDEMINNDISNNPIGLNLTSTTRDCNIINTSIINSTSSDIRFTSNSHANALNSSMNWSNINYTDTRSDLTVQWFMHVNVTNTTDSGMAGAMVLVKDNRSVLTFSGTVDKSGWLRWIVCNDYTEDVTGITIIYNPHNITASEIKYDDGYADPEPDIDTSRVVKIVLHEDVTPPAPPEDLAFTMVGDIFINISWTQPIPEDVDGYNIYINDTGSSTTFHLLGTTRNLYYNATGLIEQVTYYFEIRSFDDVPWESTALIGSNTTHDITPPLPPSSLWFTEYGGHYLNISWTDSTSVDAEGYELWVNDTGSSVNFHYLTTTLNNYYNHTGLVDETIYYYQIRVFDEIPLYSQFSFIVWAITLDVTPPAAPTGLVAKDPTVNSITLQWTPNSEIDLAGYYIYKNNTGADSAGPYHRIKTIIGTTTEYKVINLLEDTTYHFVIVAYDYVPFDSPFSEPVSASTLDITAPAAPTGLNAVAISDTQIKLNWSSNKELDITGYTIFMNDTNTGPSGNFHEIHSLFGTSTNFTVTNLSEETIFYFKILAFDDVPNNSSFSEVAYATTFDLTPPKPPGGLVISDNTNNSLTISWSANNEPDVEGYFLYRSRISTDGFSTVTSTPIKTTKYVDTGLKVATIYFYKLKAIDNVGLTSDFSAVASGATLSNQYDPEINNPVSDFKIEEDGFDNTTINLYDWFKDRNNDKLNFSVTGEDHIEVQIYQENGTVFLKPESDWNGIENLTFSATDGQHQVSDDVLITITPKNDAPGPVTITSPISGIIINDNTSLTFNGFCNDSDLIYGDELTFRWFSNISGVLGVGQILKGITLSVGEHRISLEVTDLEGVKSVANISISVVVSPNFDSDNDGMPDLWENENGLDPYDPSDAVKDSDTDKLSNLEEFEYGTDPRNPDTDNDTLTDYDEIFKYGTDPLKFDTDDDGYSDGWEVDADTDPLDPESNPGKKLTDDIEDLFSGLFMIGAIICSIVIIIIIVIIVAIFLSRRKSKQKVYDAGIEQKDDYDHDHEYEDWGETKDKLDDEGEEDLDESQDEYEDGDFDYDYDEEEDTDDEEEELEFEDIDQSDDEEDEEDEEEELEFEDIDESDDEKEEDEEEDVEWD